MAHDMFLKIDDVAGESNDGKYKGWIDVLSWSWGASQHSSGHVGTGSGSGKVSVQDLSLTKYTDKATPILWKYLCNGQHFKEIKLIMRKAGGKGGPVEYLTVNMKDCIITSISAGGSGGEDRLTENVSISFAKFVFQYTPQKTDGAADSPIPHKWNVVSNNDDV